ncbi:AtpZ/AtpI family protein [Pseudoalteromonas arctica]|uniref:ATP synthase protein I n=1 Tax=Pseudoalteromonas arctica A 37-1-2 TaxID=1117313 RepID=A0A290S2I8_9GAMM|nr:AtpZ/AtpI family protein [Pseudoalteromonas arctica]ATC86326.1 ATP synthase protein I [Pseudoalteromonas arctica A 37-1-2]
MTNKKDDLGSKDSQSSSSTLAEQVEIKAQRKLKARLNSHQKIWFGLGMMGLIGWSVAVPTILGASLGVYIDSYYESDHSWTLALLVAGLALGCFNAWHWMSKEDSAIHQDQHGDNQQKDDEDA